MSKVKRRRSSTIRGSSIARRDTFDIAKPTLRRLPRLLPIFVATSGEDHRVHLPRQSIRRLRSLSGASISPVVRFRSVPRNVKSIRDVYSRGVASRHMSFDFVLPRSAVVCARRKIRKEVIFAKGKAGRGGQRRPRRNARSYLVCR